MLTACSLGVIYDTSQIIKGELIMSIPEEVKKLAEKTRHSLIFTLAVYRGHDCDIDKTRHWLRHLDRYHEEKKK